MAARPTTSSQIFFSRMNVAFWGIWALFPVTFGVALYYLFNPTAAVEGLSPEQIKCLGDKLSFAEGSTATGIAVILIVVYELGFYLLMFALLHRMVRNFQKGAIFVERTLASVKTLGWLIAAFPIAEHLIGMVANVVLHHLDEPALGGSNFYVDLGPVAVGLFLVALARVLHHAMQMKTENDLTI